MNQDLVIIWLNRYYSLDKILKIKHFLYKPLSFHRTVKAGLPYCPHTVIKGLRKHKNPWPFTFCWSNLIGIVHFKNLFKVFKIPVIELTWIRRIDHIRKKPHYYFYLLMFNTLTWNSLSLQEWIILNASFQTVKVGKRKQENGKRKEEILVDNPFFPFPLSEWLMTFLLVKKNERNSTTNYCPDNPQWLRSGSDV